MSKMRIAVGQIWQEQNTFSPIKTELEDFEQYGLYYGKEIVEKFTNINELGGFIKVAEEDDIELIPTIRAWSWPKGNVTADTYDEIKQKLMDFLKKTGPLDGILFSFHGSMVSENVYDVEGDILETIHQKINHEIPVAISLDMHANITNRMLNNTVYMEGYHTCPHIDLFRTGQKCAGAFINIIKTKSIPEVGFVKLPIITPARLHNTKEGPLKELFDAVNKIESRSDVVGASLFPVQPWLDVPELGWSVLVYTNSDKVKAQSYAEKIAEHAWKLKEKFFVKETSPAGALKEAQRMKKGLMVISDSDATTAGAPGDNTFILEEMLKQKINYPALLPMVDKEVVYKAVSVGVGNEITCEIGGKMDNIFGKPVKITGVVKNVTDEKFAIDGHVGKNYFNMGKTVVLGIGNITILVCEKNGPIYEQTVYKKAGLNPKNFRVVVVKSPVGFRYAYEPIADKIVLADHPGLSSSNLSYFNYKNIPRPLFPFDKIDNWKR